ncbi:MAG TPA: zf-HC2 domain-containing protein, partial [Longimicrobiaceae bacterium]|nr:zf-HC2 domain-containing protein [Longimicrobiaceae bacterium]
MTTHPAEAVLHEHADGRLDAADADAVERHLAACAPCRERVERIRTLRARLAALPRAAEPRRDLWAGVATRLDEAPAPPEPV